MILKVPPVPCRPVISEQAGGRTGASQAGEPLPKPTHFSSPAPPLTFPILGISRSGISLNLKTGTRASLEKHTADPIPPGLAGPQGYGTWIHRPPRQSLHNNCQGAPGIQDHTSELAGTTNWEGRLMSGTLHSVAKVTG